RLRRSTRPSSRSTAMTSQVVKIALLTGSFPNKLNKYSAASEICIQPHASRIVYLFLDAKSSLLNGAEREDFQVKSAREISVSVSVLGKAARVSWTDAMPKMWPESTGV